MLLKTALRNMKKNPVMNIICLIQLTAVFLIAAVMVSAMSVRYRTYLPLKGLLEERGIFSQYHEFFRGAVKPGGDRETDAIFSVEELCGYMGANRAVVIRSQTIQSIEDYSAARAFFYESELINARLPELRRGRWLSDSADEFEIVITEGLFGLDVGDETELYLGQYHHADIVRARVVGVLEDDAKILGDLNHRDQTGDTYRFLYRELNDFGMPVILASANTLNKIYPEDDELFTAAAYFMYDDVSDDELIEALKTAGKMGSSVSLTLGELNENSREYLYSELMKLLPIVIILLILVTVSAVSVSAISARQRLRDYAKYYVLGLQWRQCAAVNFLQALIAGAAALIIACAGLLVIGATALSEEIMIIRNAPLILTLLGILALYLAFSMIMPLLMLRSTSPKELLV